MKRLRLDFSHGVDVSIHNRRKNSMKKCIKTSKHSILKSFLNGLFKLNIHILT